MCLLVGMIHTLVGTEGVGNTAQQVVAEEGAYDTILKHIIAWKDENSRQ